jgi:hypothetical protein
MNAYDAAETAYKNGYDKGFADGRRSRGLKAFFDRLLNKKRTSVMDAKSFVESRRNKEANK